MALISAYVAARTRLADAWRKRAVSLKAASFALIGVVNSVVDYSVFLLARTAYQHAAAALGAFASLAAACRCGTPDTLLLIAANVTSWAVAVSCSYILNSSITFAAESGRQLRLSRYAVFVVAGLLGLTANTIALVFAAQILLLPVWFAKGLAIMASFVVNFFMSHLVIFPRKK